MSRISHKDQIVSGIDIESWLPALSTWQNLLQFLVERNGGVSEVAFEVCRISRRHSATSFDTARRNLANWIAGVSVPRRQNFVTLSKALRIDEDAALKERWQRLYESVRAGTADRTQEREPPSAAPAPSANTQGRKLLDKPFKLRHALWAALAFVAISAVSLWITGRPRDDDRTIGYLPFVELRVGETALVHAKRGRCGEAAPEWREFEHEVPILQTGRLIDDGPGTSRSTTCGGTTPGRLVRFVAERPGDEIFDLFQRSIHVTVKP